MTVVAHSDKGNIAHFTNTAGLLLRQTESVSRAVQPGCATLLNRIVTRTIVPETRRASVSFLSRQPIRCHISREVDHEMKPHITLITLGIQDWQRSLEFYRDGLG